MKSNLMFDQTFAKNWQFQLIFGDVNKKQANFQLFFVQFLKVFIQGELCEKFQVPTIFLSKVSLGVGEKSWGLFFTHPAPQHPHLWNAYQKAYSKQGDTTSTQLYPCFSTKITQSGIEAIITRITICNNFIRRSIRFQICTHTHIYIYICIYIYMCVYHITFIYIYIYIYTTTNIIYILPLPTSLTFLEYLCIG